MPHKNKRLFLCVEIEIWKSQSLKIMSKLRLDFWGEALWCLWNNWAEAQLFKSLSGGGGG